MQKYVGDWAREAIGPGFVVRSCALRLGAPAHPYDTLSFSGEVTDETDGVLHHRRGRRRSRSATT